MKIILPNPRGFCAGVAMAIDVVDQALDLFAGERIFVYHEIVHNTHVVERFKSRGVTFVDDVSEVPEGSIVIFSAHGVSPAVRAAAAARSLRAIDATCPLVTKVHSEAIRYARKGYQILLVGHRNHQEIEGTRGEAPDATQVVESPDDIPNLDIRDPTKLIYLTQTTLSTDDAAVIINALKRAFPQIQAPPSEDICYATTNRQHAVRQLAGECDLTLVVGSTTSSNSKRLTEISENVGTPARLIDDASMLEEEWFAGRERRREENERRRDGETERRSEEVSAGRALSSSPKGLSTIAGGRAQPRRGAVAPPESAPPNQPDPEGVFEAPDFTVLLTAGASAPEDLVAEVCRTLVARYGATIEQRDVFDEDVYFAPPAGLRRQMQSRGIDPASRRIHVRKPEVTREVYGAVPLTVSAQRGE
ncbi:MAG: 4-hydroxy-3-methylbut-2-enyl diphosphate reductase [Phycisphaerales bacterium JB039]